MPNQTNQRSWYLKDEPLPHFGERDLFRHRAYVNVLILAVGELTPPFTLGVFVSWGVGKTSIVNDLRNQLTESTKSDKIATVNIDVWKYEGDSLRRQFLWDFQKQLKTLKVLDPKKDYVQEVYQERTEELPTRQRFDPRRLVYLFPALLVSYVAALGLLWLFLSLGDSGSDGASNPLFAFAIAFVVPAVLYFVGEISRSIVVQTKDEITRPVYFSTDQFERKFEEIVRDARCEKLLIVVDNLDRCSHDRVVEILGTVKTFLEPKGQRKCIFVIPCDDHAIRQHVKSAYMVLGGDEANSSSTNPEQYADEYLSKFFNGSVRIDPFLEEEIEPHIESQLQVIKLTEDMDREDQGWLVQLIGSLFRENPRRIKQFLNNLTSKHLLVKEREAGDVPQIHPEVNSRSVLPVLDSAPPPQLSGKDYRQRETFGKWMETLPLLRQF